MLYTLILIVGGLASLILPWWIIAPICFGLCFWLADKPGVAFCVASAAVSSLWLAFALFAFYTSEVDVLSKVTGLITANSEMLSKIPVVGVGFGIMLFIAGLVGGFSGLAGYYSGQLFASK